MVKTYYPQTPPVKKHSHNNTGGFGGLGGGFKSMLTGNKGNFSGTTHKGHTYTKKTPHKKNPYLFNSNSQPSYSILYPEAPTAEDARYTMRKSLKLSPLGGLGLIGAVVVIGLLILLGIVYVGARAVLK